MKAQWTFYGGQLYVDSPLTLRKAGELSDFLKRRLEPTHNYRLKMKEYNKEMVEETQEAV